MGNPLFATKPIDALLKEAGETGEHSLKRALGPVNLVTLGIGAIIGAGIFVLTGSAAALYAGPAIMLSYILAGLGCVFAGLCYAEFASMIPIAGSAYTYGYATLGEIIAWIIGWDLILEYAFGAATVASGWSSTLVAFLQDYGISLPPQICDVPGAQWALFEGRWAPVATFNLPPEQLAALPHATAVFNLVAFLAILGVTTILIVGIKESANFNTGVVFVKLTAVLTFIAVALPYVLHYPDVVDANWKVFLPANTGAFWPYGWSGVLYAMAHDAVLWKWAGDVLPRSRTPWKSSAIIGLGAALCVSLVPIRSLGQMVSIGTLLAFVVVCAAVLILRARRPDLERPFKTPLVPVVPILGIIVALGLMASLNGITWVRLIVWLIIGMVIYFTYSVKHSKVRNSMK